jgi:branched-chain amino acid transport system substrate-binding protein
MLRCTVLIVCLTLFVLTVLTTSSEGYTVYLPLVCRTAQVTPVPGKPVTLAILGPTSGGLASWGQEHLDGAVLAIEEWNADGGLFWQPIRWLAGDTEGDSVAGLDAAREAVEEGGAEYLVGAVCSSATIPISDYANEEHVLHITGVSTNPRVTLDSQGSVKPYVFRACFIDPFQGKAMAQFALENLEATTAAVVFDANDDYSRGLAESYRTAFQDGGGDVVVWETFVQEDTDFSGVVDQVQSAGTDVFYVPTHYEKANLVGLEVQARGITVTLLGGDGWDSSSLDLEAVDGAYFSNHFAPDDTRPIVQDFVARFQARYASTPSAMSVMAYDAASMLLQAIQDAGSNDPDLARDTMASLEYEGVSGTISFDQYHDPVKNVAIMRIQDGVITFETSVRPASVPGSGG